MKLPTQVGPPARVHDVWPESLDISVLDHKNIPPRLGRPPATVVVGLLVATGGVATFDLYLLASSGLH